VEFHSVEEARRNLKMNGMELRGQHLNINLASSRDKCKIHCVHGNAELLGDKISCLNTLICHNFVMFALFSL